MGRPIFLALSILALAGLTPADRSPAKEIVIDSILASVNGKPITLSDLQKRLGKSGHVSLNDVHSDPELRLELDNLILEQLMSEEAERRKIGVSDEDVNRYIGEVAKRNNLSQDDFQKALGERGQSLEQYKQAVKFDILKSKLSSILFQGGVGVSDADVDQYLKDHPELNKSNSKVRISQIFVSSVDHPQEDSKKRIDQAAQAIKDGQAFDTVAKEFSDSPEAKDGGSLGILSEEDLNSETFDAILSLKDGETSPITESIDGYRIFRVDERLSAEDKVKDGIQAEARKILQRNKLEGKMQTYFTSELYKLHTVDKKI